MRILFVDDDDHLTEFMAELCDRECIGFISAAHGAAAIDILKVDMAIDLIVTDCEMPHMNGLDLIAMKNEMGLPMPVIVISSDNRYAQSARSVGCLAFLDKSSPSFWKDLTDILTTSNLT